MKDKVRITAADKPKGNQGILRAFALGYPGACEEFPWGERVIKVKGMAKARKAAATRKRKAR